MTSSLALIALIGYGEAMSLPTPRDTDTARRALEALQRDPNHLELNLHATDTLPATLRTLLEAMSAGKAVAILPLESELSTFELADLLGVSRPTAISLLERGLIPYRTVGTHRRIRLEDALAFQTQQRQRSLEAMSALQAENEALGLQ
jgi:excisionase family DNA binding protein